MDTEAMNKQTYELKHLLQKYESVQKNTIIMDDYDGGKIDMAEKIITDLKALLKRNSTAQRARDRIRCKEGKDEKIS